MEQFTRRWLGMEFRDRFHNVFGDDFQVFFGRIMNLRFPSDFNQTRPWGKLGDNKCDGYLPSQRIFYQCYAPNELSKAETLAKLETDFLGALPFQNKYFDVWVFVHNARDGRIPTWLSFKIEEMRQKYPNMKIETLGFIELFDITLQISQDKLVDIFGPLPGIQDMLAIEFQDIRPLLEYISKLTNPEVSKTKPVSSEKLAYNQLNQDVEYLLKHGMIKAADVRSFLDQTPDKELAAKVTSAFRDKYYQLKEEMLEPDSIFSQLRIFAQGPFAQGVKTEGAALAVIAYLFEECDIFENPQD